MPTAHDLTRPSSPTAVESITAEWDATEHLPSDERERARDILVIKHGPPFHALVRNQAIDASPNVIRLADARAKLPKGL